MNLEYREFGDGLPVVLLHAFPLSSQMWEPNIESLAHAGFRLVLPDLRGFGYSLSCSDPVSIEEMAIDVSLLLEKLELRRAIIGGLSMGGYVAFNLYRLFQDRFLGLILCDTACESDSEYKKQARLDLIEKILARGSQAMVENMLPKLLSKKTRLHNKGLIERLTADFLKCNSTAAVAALRGMAERIDHTHILPGIDVPTCLIFGEDDQITNLAAAELMLARIPNATLSVIENAGHYSNLENPDAFNVAMLEFLEPFGR